jgi:hypothetical protein
MLSVNDGFGKMSYKAVMAYTNVLIQNLPGGAHRNYRTPQSGLAICRLIFKQGRHLSNTKQYNINHNTLTVQWHY